MIVQSVGEEIILKLLTASALFLKEFGLKLKNDLKGHLTPPKK